MSYFENALVLYLEISEIIRKSIKQYKARPDGSLLHYDLEKVPQSR